MLKSMMLERTPNDELKGCSKDICGYDDGERGRRKRKEERKEERKKKKINKKEVVRLR